MSTVVVGPSVPKFLEGKEGVVHHSLVTLVLIDVPRDVLASHDAASAYLFSSKHAVKFFSEALETHQLPLPDTKTAFCVGPETGRAVRTFLPQLRPIHPSEHCQEGLAELVMQQAHGTLFWPRSDHARRYLPTALQAAGIWVDEVPLYTTSPTSSMPDLRGVREVVFTCPSCVDAFFALYHQEIPSVTFTAIGPITNARLKEVYGVHVARSSVRLQ